MAFFLNRQPVFPKACKNRIQKETGNTCPDCRLSEDLHIMKKALVLCATIPHTLLIEKLKQRGYHTLVADMNPNAPGVSAADEFVCISAFDKDQ